MDDMSDEDFQNLYSWIDEVPLSRPKRNITRDFSDGGKCFNSPNCQNVIAIYLSL